MKNAPITLPRRRPRNPFVAAVRMRQAGAHGRHGSGARRQRERRALQSELAALHPPCR